MAKQDDRQNQEKLAERLKPVMVKVAALITYRRVEAKTGEGQYDVFDPSYGEIRFNQRHALHVRCNRHI